MIKRASKAVQLRSPIWNRDGPLKYEIECTSQVVLQTLRYMDQRSEIFAKFKHFSMQSTNPQFLQQALEDIVNLEYDLEQSYQTKSLDSPELFIELQRSLQPERLSQIRSLISPIYKETLLEVFEKIVNELQGHFQELILVNVVTNINQTLQGTNSEKLKQVLLKIDGILKDNICQPMNLLKILGNAYDIISNNSIQAKEIFSVPAETLMREYPFKGKLSIIETRHMLYTLFFAKNVPKTLSDQVLNQLCDHGVNGNSEAIIDLLGLLLLHGIPATERLLESVKQAQKLRIIQIFIIVKSYQQANIPINEHSQYLFNQLYLAQQFNQDVDVKTVMMLGRILDDLLRTCLTTSRNMIEKKCEKILIAAEKQVRTLQNRITYTNILQLANIFNRNLQIPTFGQHFLHASTPVCTQQSLPAYMEHVQIFTKKYTLQTMYLSRADQLFAIPDKSQITYINQLITLLVPFPEACGTILQAALIDGIKLPEEYHKQLQSIEGQSLLISEHIKRKTLPTTLLYNILKVLDQIPINEAIKIVYNISEHVQKEKVLNTLNQIQQLIQQNAMLLVQSIELEEFTQTFTQCASLSEFKNYEYILPIFDKFDVYPPEALKQQLFRCCREWNQLIIENLILFSKYFQDEEFFYRLSETITLAMKFNKSSLWNSLDKSVTHNLVLAFVKQIKTTTTNEGVKIIGYLAAEVYELLTINEKMAIVKMLGQNPKMYHPLLVEKLNKLTFQANRQAMEYGLYYTNQSLREAIFKFSQTDFDNKYIKSLINNKILLKNIDSLEYLIEVYQPGLKVPSFANTLIDQCRLTILQALSNITLKTSPDKTYFTVEYREDRALAQQAEEYLKMREFGSNSITIDGNRIRFDKSVQTLDNPNQKARWKVSYTNEQQPDSQVNLLQFLTQDISQNQLNEYEQIYEYISNISNQGQSEEFAMIVKQNLIDEQQVLSKDDEYLNFLIALTLSLPPGTTHLANGIEETRWDLKINEKVPIYILYAKDLILSSKPTPSPRLLLRAAHLSKSGRVYILNYDEWSKVYYSRKKQEEFTQMILTS